MSDSLRDAAVEAAGSKENWNVVRAWASQEATTEEKEHVNAALRQGGLVAKAVVQQLVSLYEQRNTLTRTPARGTKESASPGTGGPAVPMTAKAYAEAVEALYAKMHGRIEGTPEYAALQAQRLAARRAGY